MTKTAKTALFLVAASLGNIAATVVMFAILMLLYSLTLARILPQSALQYAVLVCLGGSMVGTFVVYRKVLVWLQKRFSLNETLGFGPGRPGKRN